MSVAVERFLPKSILTAARIHKRNAWGVRTPFLQSFGPTVPQTFGSADYKAQLFVCPIPDIKPFYQSFAVFVPLQWSPSTSKL